MSARIETTSRPRFELGFAALLCALLAVWLTFTPLAPVDEGQQAAYALDSQSFERGELPAWNRFNGYGAPHLAHPNSAPLSPFTWLHCALPADRAARLEALVKLFLAGFLAYGCLAAMRLAPIACVFGASAFLTSSTMLEHMTRPSSAVALALPAGLWVLESLARKLEREPPRGEVGLFRLASPTHAALFALIVACGCASGDPWACAWVAVVLALFAAARGWSVWKRAAPLDGVAIVAVGAQLGLIACLGACACAVQLVPFAEYMLESALLRRLLVGEPEWLATATWPSTVMPALLAVFCAALAPFVTRERRLLTFFLVVSAAWIVFAYDVLGLGAWIRNVGVFRLMRPASGWPVLHFAVAACAAFFVHQVWTRGPRRSVVAAVATLCCALTALFVARAGVWQAAGARNVPASEVAALIFSTSVWLMTGALLLASAWVLRERWLRSVALALAVLVHLAMTVFPYLQSERAAFDNEPPAEIVELSRAHIPLFLGRAPLAPHTAARHGIESFANADGIGIERVERLRETFFVTSRAGTIVRSASSRGLQLFGIDRVLAPGEWIDVDTWTGFAAPNPRAEHVTSPLVPDAAVELDFVSPHELANAVCVVFETGSRPLLQNIELEIVDRVTEERLAHRVISPDFQNPNRKPRVLGILELPRLPDWQTRKLRLVVRSNDGAPATAWSLVARRDWMSVMNLGLWRRDGVRPLPLEVRHPSFTGFACRQFGAELRGSIVVDVAWNAGTLREVGALASQRVLEVVAAAPVFRTVSRSVAARDGESALALLQAPAFDPTQTVVLEGGPAASTANETARNEAVELLSRDARSVRLRTTRREPGWLVTSQPWYPGWRARVNGVEKPILRANYAFGAVALDAELLEIVLEYDPTSIRVGMWLSCAALAALVGWFVLSRVSGLSRRTRSA